MTADNEEFNLSKFTRLSRQDLWGHLFSRKIVGAPYNSEVVFIYFSDYFGGRFLALDGKQYGLDGKSRCGKYEIIEHVKSHGILHRKQKF